MRFSDAVPWVLGLALSCNRVEHSNGTTPTASPLPAVAKQPFAATAGRSVLFVSDGALLFPLFCHDRDRRMWGADCVGLLPTGKPVVVFFSNQLEVALVPSGRSRCAYAGQPLPAFAMASEQANVPKDGVALWADLARPVLVVPPSEDDWVRETPSQRRGMFAACERLGSQPVRETDPPKPIASWAVDLDGDGVRERLDEWVCPGLVANRVLVGTLGRRPELTLLMRAVKGPSSQARVAAVVDADGDGIPESVVSIVSPEKRRFELAHLRDNNLFTEGFVECEGPASSKSPRK